MNHTEKQKLSEGFDWNKATEEEIHAYVEALEQGVENLRKETWYWKKLYDDVKQERDTLLKHRSGDHCAMLKIEEERDRARGEVLSLKEQLEYAKHSQNVLSKEVVELKEQLRDDTMDLSKKFVDMQERAESAEAEVKTLRERKCPYFSPADDCEYVKKTMSLHEDTIDKSVIPLQECLAKAEAEVKQLEELLDMKVAQPLKTIEALEKRLAKAQELVEKWRRVEILANAEQVAIKMAHNRCADELDDALK